MSDLRTTLASVRDGLHPRDDEATFESLRRIRARRRRRQRIVAVGVATMFAIGGTAIVVRAFQAPPAVTPSQPVSVQPQPGKTITVGPQGQTTDMVAGFGKLWIAAYGVAGGQGASGSALVQVDPVTMEIVGTTPVPQVPTWETGGGGLLATPEAIWVAAYSMKGGDQLGALYRVDPASGRVQTYTDPAVEDFRDAASDGTYLWLAAARGDRAAVVRFDPGNGNFSDPVTLSGDTARYIEAVPGEVVVSQLSWVGGQGPCVSLASIDPTRLAVLAESPSRNQVCSPDRTGLGVALFVLNGEIWSTPAGAFAPVDPATAEPSAVDASYDEMAFPRSDPVVAPTGVWYGAYPGGNGSRQDILSRFDPETNTVQAYNVEVGWSVGVALDNAIWAMGWDGTLTKIALEPDDIGTGAAALSPESFLPPYLSGGDGWFTVSSDPVPANSESPAVVWASTTPVANEDVQLNANIPPSTITQLPRDGIVIAVQVIPAAFEDTSVPFPYADLSFELTKATERGPEAEEPPGDYAILQTESRDAATLVRVYFGSPHPSPQMVDRAQAELDTLQLPPTCTVGGPGSYAVSASSTQASPGEVITLTGAVPFQYEDGSFNESGEGHMVAWWNVAPDDWSSAFTGASSSPPPAVEGEPIIQLGSAPMNTCSFDISFAVPDAAPADYPVLVTQEAGGGGTLEDSLVVHVPAS